VQAFRPACIGETTYNAEIAELADKPDRADKSSNKPDQP